ncbi:MAG TPA: ATP-dependent metallopeptidase FtsH/Yme1/Tma family protein [Flavobacteriales bacterium]|nr:ATP-dependent metallopeptidase FtsH/Yme1/Tma family protein [Flavobacteriales bacterium]HIK63214.1 ATP-dependent metallopeptidase FtsH/Yme1/Tma family protein [Flavobacteriales bacterium]
MTNKRKSTLPKGFKDFKFKIYWVYALIFLFFIGLQFIGTDVTKPTDWQKFNQKMLQNQKVEKVVIVNKEKAYIYIKKEFLAEEEFKEVSKKTFGDTPNYGPHYYFEISSVDHFLKQMEDAQVETEEFEKIYPTSKTEKDVFGDILGWILPLAFFIFIWLFIMKRMSGGGGAGQIFNIGKTQGKLVDKKNIKITFKDVAGLEEAKEEIAEIVDFLKLPEKYTKLGGKIPRGALLIGLPGTGKTLLAKAVAGEAKVPFFSLTGSDFVEMFVGVGASRVRDLFKQAKEKAPAIIFIDEIDAIGRARGKNAMTGSNDERENTLNQLLTEMDGFGTNSGVIVMAATNRADVLDKALTRAGRFDRQIFVDLPDLVERKEIFEVHLKPIKLAKKMDVNFLARQTPGFSGADIANVCNEAALIAARKERKEVGKQDFLDAVDRIIGGLEKKSKIISPNEKKTIAFHEAGHATVSWMLQYASPLIKVTIVPRGKSLGAAWYLPEERQLTTTEQMLDEICAAMGGRAAEEVFFGKISTGALSDLEKVTKMAYAMVSVYGLSAKVGNISYYDSSGQQSGFTKPYSEERAQLIDKEVSQILEQQYQRAKDILLTHKEKVNKLGSELLENEVIFKDDLTKIFGERQWKSYEEEQLLKLDEEEKISTKKTKVAVKKTTPKKNND